MRILLSKYKSDSYITKRFIILTSLVTLVVSGFSQNYNRFKAPYGGTVNDIIAGGDYYFALAGGYGHTLNKNGRYLFRSKRSKIQWEILTLPNGKPFVNDEIVFKQKSLVFSKLFIAIGDKTYYTKDFGESWVLYTALDLNGDIIIVNDTAYISHFFGSHQSTDSCLTWNKISPPRKTIGNIYSAPYMYDYRGRWSVDFGLSWNEPEKLLSGVTDMIAVGDTIWAASENYLSKSVVGGSTWTYIDLFRDPNYLVLPVIVCKMPFLIKFCQLYFKHEYQS